MLPIIIPSRIMVAEEDRSVEEQRKEDFGGVVLNTSNLIPHGSRSEGPLEISLTPMEGVLDSS